MTETDLDNALESAFRQSFALTPERERALHRRIRDRIQVQGQDWTAFTRVMLNLRASLRPGLECLAWPLRFQYQTSA
jgi:hypothetical protein